MNKHIVADMLTEKFSKEIGMVEKQFPADLKVLDADTPFGAKLHTEASLYHADKIKKISFLRNTMGEMSAGSVIMIVPEDTYDLPFIVADVTFWSGEQNKIFTEFDANPLVKDADSVHKYDEFLKWQDELGKLSSEPVTGIPEPGEYIKSVMSTVHYLRFIPAEFTDEVLKLTDRFFDIFLEMYAAAEPVQDSQKRIKMDAFRAEYNSHILNEDPSAMAFEGTFGREKVQRFYDHLVNL